MRSHASSGGGPSSSGSSEKDLLIVGPGVLGSLIGKLWSERHAEAAVVGQTNTDTNHDRLKALGITPRLKQDADDAPFPNVIFSAPPSGSKDYVSEVKGALKKWDQRGTFIFTSSSGVMNPAAGEKLTEDTSLHTMGTSDRLDRLLRCEQAVLEAGGCVARFVGLYHAKRGAHMFFLRQGTVERWGGHVVNLIHYEDAAEFCLKILEGATGSEPFNGQIFFGTDCSPLTFQRLQAAMNESAIVQEMMDTTVSSGLFEGSCEFVGQQDSEPSGGSSNLATQEALQWSPKYTSFRDFIQSGAQDIFQSLP